LCRIWISPICSSQSSPDAGLVFGLNSDQHKTHFWDECLNAKPTASATQRLVQRGIDE